MRFHDWEVIPTPPEVYAAVYKAHSLKTFSSFTDPTGTFRGGPGEEGRIETVLGLEGADYPLFALRTTFPLDETGKQCGDWVHEYYLIVAVKEVES